MGRNHLPGGAELKAVARPTISETQNEGMGFGLGFSVVLDAARTKVACSEGELAWGGLASTAFWVDPKERITAHFFTQLAPVEHLSAALAAAPARLPGAGGLMHAKLVGVPGSHPCVSAELMLRYKGVEFTRLDLPNMTHKAMLPLLRYRGSTVPVITLEGKRVSGTMKIARALEHSCPTPPLFRRTARRSKAPRPGPTACSRTACASSPATASAKDPEAMASFLDRAGDEDPGAHDAHRPAGDQAGRAAADAHRRGDRADVPGGAAGQLDRVDALLAEGVIGGERPNAADFQVAPSVRLMLTFDQLREHIDARPAGAHARAARAGLSRPVPGSVPSTVASVLRNSRGDVAAWLWHPEGATGAVVLGHGLSAVHDQRLTAYAERFAAAGLAALVFDYRHFGASGGEPRQLFDIDAAGGLADRARLRPRAAGDRARRPVRLLVRRRARDHARDRFARAEAVVAQCPMTDGFKASLLAPKVTAAKLTKLALQDAAAPASAARRSSSRPRASQARSR